MTAEMVLLKLIEELIAKLPATLTAFSAMPLRWLKRKDDGGTEWKEDLVTLEQPAEIWAQQSPSLNFPALMIHYSDTTYIRQADEDATLYLSDHKFIVDLALTHDEPEQLVWLWLRYMEVIQDVIKRIIVPGLEDIQINAQRITEDGPFNSLYLRRGNLEISVLI